MQRLKLLLILLVLGTLSACSKNEDDDPDPEPTGIQETLIAEGTIGTGGGTVGNDQITLNIPEGAFPATQAIKIFMLDTELFEGHSCTPHFKVTGLPQDFSKPFRVCLKYEGSLQSEYFMALGMDNYIKSLDSVFTTFHCHLASDSAGYLVSNIQPSENKLNITNGNFQIAIVGVNGARFMYSGTGHFMILYSPPDATDADAQMVMGLMEEAYETIANLGFSYTARSLWPFRVELKELDNTGGYHVDHWMGINLDYIELNVKDLSSPEEMKVTAGHEFFHFAQTCYNASKSTLWLDEASSTWIEAKFAPQPGTYYAPNHDRYKFAPYGGMVSNMDTSSATHHGYGMAGMIKYLATLHDESIVYNLYDKIFAGKDVMTAISESAGVPSGWYTDFLNGYALGNIYSDHNVYGLKSRGSGEMKTQNNYGQGIEQNFPASYSDLSAKSFHVITDFADYPEGTLISFEIDNNVAEVYVYKHKTGPTGGYDLLGHSSGTVKVNDYDYLTSNGWDLAALVINKHATAPYNQHQETINLKVKIEEGLNLDAMNTAEVVARVGGIYLDSQQSTISDQFTASSHDYKPFIRDGNTFTYSENNQFEEIHYSFIVNTEERIVSLFTISYSYDDGVLQNSSYATGENIPLEGTGPSGISFKIEGNVVCDHLTEVEGSHFNGSTGYSKELIDITCDPAFNRWIIISMHQ